MQPTDPTLLYVVRLCGSDLKHRQTLREALTAGLEASLVTVSEAERDSLGINDQSAVTQRLFALIPIAQGIRLADIRARDLGSLASPYGTNNGTYALRSGSYSDGLARRCYTMVQGRQTDGSPDGKTVFQQPSNKGGKIMVQIRLAGGQGMPGERAQRARPEA